jgi:hypothetical protein
MVDLWELIKKYYFAPATKDSNSIKYVLPAMLHSSGYLKNKCGKPVYRDEIKSLNFSNQTWITYDDLGHVNNPYQLLAPIFEDIDTEMLDELLTSEEGEIRDGGATMRACAQMQFTQMNNRERELITRSLLRYCELDTLAMVMIWEGWREQL